MNEQIAQWRKESHKNWLEDADLNATSSSSKAYENGYLRARAEQATEIAALKAQVAEHMPLAKFGAMVLGNRILMFQPSSVTSHALKAGVLISDSSIIQAVAYAPNIEATINKLLKD
jgi:hypothetical protein